MDAHTQIFLHDPSSTLGLGPRHYLCFFDAPSQPPFTPALKEHALPSLSSEDPHLYIGSHLLGVAFLDLGPEPGRYFLPKRG
jgi:hypothetical protein